MTPFRRKVIAKGTRVLDIMVMVAAFTLALYIHAPEEAPENLIDYLYVKIKIINVLVLLLLIITWSKLFKLFGLYPARRLTSRFREWLDIFRAVTVSVLFLAGISVIFYRGNVDQNVIFTFWGLCIFFTILERTLVREFLIYLRKRGRNLRDVLFIGSGPLAVNIAEKITTNPGLGYRLVGYIDDNFDRSNVKPIPQGLRRGDLDDFERFLENNVVDEVYIVLPIKTFYEKIREIVSFCQEFGIMCRVPSDWFDLKTGSTYAFQLDGISFLTISMSSPKQIENLWIKRVVDLAIAATALIIFSPLMLIISVLVKLTSEGPILFKQERIGYNRRRFKMLKFRTMVKNAEKLQDSLLHLNESDGPTFKIRNDPRITGVGRWLRKTSLDELPQLFNVVRGDMSLVGPRPLPMRDVAGMDERWHKRRFSMRPGLTCLWQINGRNKITFQDWMKLDLEYIDSWSLGLDMKIIIKTLPVIIKAGGQ